MRGKSHQYLGKYLADKYMCTVPNRYIRAFLIGCIEPDRNPTTYLKGSLRSQWLRGHNWDNAQKYMQRISRRLENRKKLKLLDYYTMGKLIHYTTDAFTSAHNSHFTENLAKHKQYEADLQNHFIRYLSQNPKIHTDCTGSAMETIRTYHQEYLRRPVNIHTDTRYAIIVSSMVMVRLFAAN